MTDELVKAVSSILGASTTPKSGSQDGDSPQYVKSAAQVVFDTTELLEHIFVHLPVRQILSKAQRLSRRSKAVIDCSTHIQKKLWYRAKEAEVLSPPAVDNDLQFHDIMEAVTYARPVEINPIVITESTSPGAITFPSPFEFRPSSDFPNFPNHHGLMLARTQLNSVYQHHIIGKSPSKRVGTSPGTACSLPNHR